MATLYDVPVIAVRPGTHPQTLAVPEKSLPKDPALLTSVTGAVTRFLHVWLHVWPYKSVGERARGCVTKPSPAGCGRRPAGQAICCRSRSVFICRRRSRR